MLSLTYNEAVQQTVLLNIFTTNIQQVHITYKNKPNYKIYQSEMELTTE